MSPRRASLLAIAVILLPACGDRGDAPLSGVLITLDTTRTDALGCYGGDGATPHIDRLARESVVYEAAHTVAPVTLPAHASMLTGFYPPRHTVRTNGLVPLPASAETLAERAREAGFETAAFLAAAVLDPPYGLNQGFDVYDTPRGTSRLATSHMVERGDAEVSKAAVEWLRARDSSKPFFLWVHFFNPHAPYSPPPAFRRGGRSDRDLYLGEVAAMDAAFGELVEALEETQGLDRTLVVVVADHGEALGAHGETTHTILVYEELLSVPFLIRHPDGRGAGERVKEIVSVVDVFPTMLEGLGLGTPGDVDGVPLSGAAESADRGVYFESFDGYLNYGWSPLAGWMNAEGKYTHATAPELYDLRSDRAERVNRLATDPEAAEPYIEAIRAMAAKPALERGGDETVDESHRAALQALGYTAAASGSTPIPHPLAATGFPHPVERMDELDAFHAAVLGYNAASQRRDQAGVDEAIRRMTRIADENPNNAYANSVLGSFLYSQGRAADAVRRLRAMPEHGQDRSDVQDVLGHCLEHLGQIEHALPCFLRALNLKPGDAHQLEDVIRVLRKLGRHEEARPFVELLGRGR